MHLAQERSVAGSYEHGNTSPGSLKTGKFLTR
jgi:hypothetical protein